MNIKENFQVKLNELRGKSSLSDDERKKLKGRIYKKHGEAWDDTIKIRKEKKSSGPADTRDKDKLRNRLAGIYNKLEEASSGKPPRSEHSWPTSLDKKTGKWMWANAFKGGHESAEAANKHAKEMIEKNKKTKVNLSDLKPRSK